MRSKQSCLRCPVKRRPAGKGILNSYQQIDNIVLNIHEVFCEIREGIGKFPDAAALEFLIVRGNARAFGDICT